YIATTQFQATYARQAFPCFDEPAIKAKFRVILVRKPPMISLSNMLIIRHDKRDNGFIADVYNVTSKMSTYLLAFIVCDFSSLENKTKTGVQYRVWARPEAIDQARFALDIGIKVLEYFEDYFGVPFPLPKQDMIAIPDFAAGAMENWGLITYRETAMLYDPKVSSTNSKQMVAVVVSHELAHQWFGNLVTPRWWDDLWLNEGFASYVEYMGVNFVYPKWKMFQQFIFKSLQGVMQIDGLASSHPIYETVNNPDEIHEIFDGISYQKGASVIRMMKFFLGEETFRKGLRTYLEKLAYGEAFHDDLWNELEKQSKKDGRPLKMKDIMDTWTLQMNYPLVTIQRTGEHQLTLTQERFLVNPNATQKYNSTFGYKWQIPFVYTTSKEWKFNKTAADVIWIGDKVEQPTIIDRNLPRMSDKKAWIIGNCKQYGYYRMNYDVSNWKALIEQLNTDHKVIHVINRAQIIDDAWSLARAGMLDIKIALGTLEYLNKEEEWIPWFAASNHLYYVKNMLSRTGAYRDLALFMQRLVTVHYYRIGWDNSGTEHTETFMRQQIISIACHYNVKGCTEEATRQFHLWMEQPDHNEIDPNLRKIVYCTALRHGGATEWDFAYEQYKKSNIASEKQNLLVAMSCSQEPWILSRFLERTLDSKEIRRQDALSPFFDVSRNPIGQMLVWDFVLSRLATNKSSQENLFPVFYLFPSITDFFNCDHQLKQLEAFVESQDKLASSKRAYQQAIEETKTNIKWMKNYKSIQEWLSKANTRKIKQTTDVRLPRSIVPLVYNLEMNPNIYSGNPSNFTFKGKVDIRFLCQNSTDNITLHILKLEILGDIIVEDLTAKKPISVRNFEEIKEKEFLVVYLNENMVTAHRYKIVIQFTGSLLPDLKGFYFSSYEYKNQTQYLATTQFQATNARKAFPCFDEPALKAKFNVVLVRHKNMSSLSNQQLLRSEERGNNFVADYFDTTPEMSTYLLAFIVSDFSNITKQAGNITLRVWARKNAIHRAEYALDVGSKLLQFFEKYFQIPYRLPKLDMVAVPDFLFGGMENWGLVIYKETMFLTNNVSSTFGEKNAISTIVCHEIAHQWFGNLVTLKWWDDLWLNEGFASYMELVGINHINPHWHKEREFSPHLDTAMKSDDSVNSHPIYVPVSNPGEIIKIFDIITYTKGAAIIRMMEFFLGTKTFEKGINTYLKKNSLGTVFHDDLWQTLSKAWNDRDVKHIMDTWTLQMNYPLLNVSLKGNKLSVTQQRYLASEDKNVEVKYKSPFDYKWEIPFTFTTGQEMDFNKTNTDIIWIHKNQSKAEFTLPSVWSQQYDDWIIANIQHKNYYRVTYDYNNWIRIIDQLNKDHQAIHEANRIQISLDTWALANSGHLDISIPLRALEYLKSEKSYMVWVTAQREITNLKNMLYKTPRYGDFQNFIQNLVSGLYKEFGWNTTVSNIVEGFDQMLPSMVIITACEYELEECKTEALNYFNKWRKTGNTGLERDLNALTYCMGVRYGDEKEWNFVYSKYKTSTDAEKQLILKALSCTRHPWLLNKYLKLVMDSDKIRYQDVMKVLMLLISNPIGEKIVWDFVRANWDELSTKFADHVSLFSVFHEIAIHFYDAFGLKEVKYWMTTDKYMNKHRDQYEDLISRIKSNIKMMNKNYGKISDWLDQQKN
ncbi:aminopeptidase N-like, partial [Argonauta hians]